MNYENISHGDMPSDSIKINESHIQKAERVLPVLLEEMKHLDKEKTVIAVCGGSGVGKSEVASLLGYMLTESGKKTYVLSGDNYPHRIPKENDTERLRVYEQLGSGGLNAYLGSPSEINFSEIQQIVDDFKCGKSPIRLKRMGRIPSELWYDDVDFSNTDTLIIEWTHGNSDNYTGVDIPILLNSTPEETLAHRRARNRDGAVDSSFTMMVLGIEQEQLKRQAHKAKIIVTKAGELISYEKYCEHMGVNT